MTRAARPPRAAPETAPGGPRAEGGPRIAALQMHDPPELRGATDALWSALRAALSERGVAAPEALSRPADHHAPWERPDLLLAQTCGWPYARALRGRVRLVATPVYDAEGCAGSAYRSAIVVRAEAAAESLAALNGARLAYNSPLSQSGVHALRAAVAPLAAGRRFFGGAVETGGHRASAEAVAQGAADLASLDCVSWALIRDRAPALATRLRVLGWTPAAPGLPLITAGGTDAPTLAALRSAVLEIFADPATAALRRPLRIAGAEVLGEAAYARIDALAAEADRLGCPPLA